MCHGSFCLPTLHMLCSSHRPSVSAHAKKGGGKGGDKGGSSDSDEKKGGKGGDKGGGDVDLAKIEKEAKTDAVSVEPASDLTR